LVEQLPLELDDVVRLLSPSSALAEFHGDRKTKESLQVLSDAICKGRDLQYSPVEVAEIWSSLGEKEKDQIRLGFDASRWRLVVPFPLATGEPARTMRLRGYGNAINSEAAAIFIEAVM